jgi:hypothetical protein
MNYIKNYNKIKFPKNLAFQKLKNIPGGKL